MEAAVAVAAAGDRPGVLRQIASYLGEVQLAEKRKEITKQQADMLRTFGAKALTQLVFLKA